MKKICSKCHIEKSIDDFNKDRRTNDGHFAWCKACTKVKSEEYYRKNKEIILAKDKIDNQSMSGKYRIYKACAKQKGIDFKLLKEEFSNLFYMSCYYCGELISKGVDRIDSDLGYVLENCVPCCSMCNYMKKDYSRDDFLNQIKKIYNHYSTIK